MRPISLVNILISFLFLLTFPSIAGNLSLSDFIIVSAIIILFWALGRQILHLSNVLNTADGLLYEGIAIFLGGTLSFPFMTVCHYFGISKIFTLLPGIISMALIIQQYFGKKLSITMGDGLKSKILVLLLIIVSLFYGENLYEYTSPNPLLRTIDYSDNLFFTSLVVSMKNGTINNAFYEIGTPINYHVGSFMWPAVLSSISGINAHISQWGIWIPFLRFLFLYVLCEFSMVVLSKTFQFKPEQYYYLRPFVVLLFILLSAINPQYLVKLDFEKILWIGTPFTLPDLPAIGAGFTLSLIILLLLINDEVDKSIPGRIFFAFLLGVLIIFKVNIYFALAPIIFLYTFWKLIKEKRPTFYTALWSLPITITAYVIFFTSGSTTKNTFKLGWMSEDFLRLMHLDNQPLVVGFIASLAVIFIIWANWNLFFIGLSNFYLKNRKADYLLLANFSVFGLLCTVLLANTFYIFDYDDLNRLLGDQSMNLMQFIKASLVFVHVFGIIALIGVFRILNGSKKIWVYGSLISIWCLLVLISILGRQSHFSKEALISNEKWAKEVVQEIENISANTTGFFAMNSNPYHSSFYITAHEVGRWWTTTYYGAEGGQRPKINMYRYRAVKNFIEGNAAKSQRMFLLKNNVKYIVAIPENLDKLKNLRSQGHVIQVSGCNWVFRICE